MSIFSDFSIRSVCLDRVPQPVWKKVRKLNSMAVDTIDCCIFYSLYDDTWMKINNKSQIRHMINRFLTEVQRRNDRSNYPRITRINARISRIINYFILKWPFRNLPKRLDEEMPIRKTNSLSTATAVRVFVFPEFRSLIRQISAGLDFLVPFLSRKKEPAGGWSLWLKSSEPNKHSRVLKKNCPRRKK